MNKRKIIFVLSVCCVLLIMLCICFFSHQTSQKSYEVTGTVVSGINKKPVTQSEWDTYSSYIPIIRKVAHVLLYAMLGFFSLISLNFAECKKEFSNFKKVLYTLLFCIGYGVLDEFHQSFIPGRGASVGDVIIDALGALIGTIICFSIFVLLKYFLIKRELGGQ